MSKMKKVPVKKLTDQKFTSHYSSLSMSNSNQMLSNNTLSLDKQELHSQSPYAKKISKVRSTSIIKERSTSIIKDSSLYQPSGLVSPPLNPKFGINLKSKINLSTSFVQKIKEANESQIISKKKPLVHRKSIENELYLIELKIEEIVCKHKENGISNEVLEKYKEIFEEIIFKDKIFGNFLSKIKFAYEDWIKSKFSTLSESSQLKSDLSEFKKKLTEEVDMNKRLHKKLQKFSKENVDLGRALEERESNFKSLQEYLVKVTNINIETIPQDKLSWKVLVSENRSYSELCSKMKKKIRSLKNQEKKFMKLFWELKQKGYPVETTYDKLDTSKCKEENLLTLDDVSDNEPINADPPKNIPRPVGVPVLKMNMVEPNSFSDERNSDSDDNFTF
jgi:Translin-associated factor X-interacting N-terminus